MQKIGLHVLRLGLAAMFLWFGFSQLTDTGDWVGWVPDWVPAFLNVTPTFIVLVNGTFEVIAGALLAVGLFVRPVAILLAVHLALITTQMGFTDIGARDFGLTMATIALALLFTTKQKRFET